MVVSADRRPVWIAVDDAECRISPRHQLRIGHFRLLAGQHWCVFGGNGAGKSLFAALLAGRLRSGMNRVHYASGLDPRRDIVTVSFEEQQRLQTLDQRHDISEYSPAAADAGTTVRMLLCADRVSDGSQSDRLVDQLGLTDVLEQGIRYLSSGQMRRAMLAAALLRGPRILILDEPLESIDRDSRNRIAAVIHDWQSDSNASLVLNRRAAGLLPGMTHLALMQDLRIDHAGCFTNRVQDLDGLLPELPLLPGRLPTAPQDRALPAWWRSDAAPVELRGVSARHGNRQVLEDLHWSVGPGQHVLVEGPNGCGKSTLLALLTGDNHKAYGQDVFLFGRRRGSGESVWEVKSLFGAVSNELHNRYARGWRALDVVVSGFFDSVGLYDDAGASQITLAEAWLHATGLRGVSQMPFHELSFGQQRLVLLARAMVKHPPLLVLDEPCVGLDNRYRERVMILIDRIAGTGETQLIYVSHTTGEAPDCINQRVRFLRRDDGTYRICISP